MAIIDNIDYHKIIKYRRDSERLLNMMLDSDNETYNIMLQSLVSLFIIDYDNIEKEFFDEINSKYIMNLINKFIDNEDDSIKINKNELSNILELYNKGKIDYTTNKVLVLRFASLYNEECNNNLMKINIDNLEHVCNLFK